MLRSSKYLLQPINLFIRSADELFGPITTIHHPGRAPQNIPWSAFTFKPADWDRVNTTPAIIADANALQHYFSYDAQPTLWCAIPAFEELLTTWEAKHDSPNFILYKSAIDHGLQKLTKYYNKFDHKPMYVLALGMLFQYVLVLFIY